MESNVGALLNQLSLHEQETCIFDEKNYSVLYAHSSCFVIIDYFTFSSNGETYFDYREYTSCQNRIMQRGKPVYRFLAEDVGTLTQSFIDRDIIIPFQYATGQDRGMTVADASSLEYFFENRFCEV